MTTDVLETPATPTLVPGTPEEQALRAAWEARGQQVVDQAEQLAVLLSMRVEHLQGVLETSPNRVSELHSALIEQHRAVHRHHYLQAISLAEPPEPLPKTSDVASSLVTRFARSRPTAFAQLVGKVEAKAVAADSMVAACEARMAAFRDDFQAGRADLGAFLQAFSQSLTEKLQAETRAACLRAAAQAAQRTLKTGVGSVLGSLSDLKSGLRDCLALGQQSDMVVSQLTALAAQQAAVEADLMRLGLDDPKGSGAKPGPIGAELQSMRSALVEQQRALRRESIATTGSSANELVTLAAQGDPTAIMQIIATVRAKPLAFRARLADDLVETMAESLAGNADVFAELLTS
jgi:hypothetical protein